MTKQRLTMKRRDALKTLGALAGTAGMARLLPACGGEGSGPNVGSTLVVLMMENRSYDHVLGARAFEGLPGDGLTADMGNPDLNGTIIQPYAATRATMCNIDPPHGWTAARTQFNSGANDGFVRAHQRTHSSATAVEPMQYHTRETMPVTWALADAFTTCDRYFCSVMGPTWPNRMYWHTGQSNGINNNSLPGGGFTWPSIYHRLEEAGVGWGYYYGNIAVAALIQDLPGIDAHIHPFGRFFEHAEAGTLPPVVYIDPAFYANDDHPPLHPIIGQELIASIYTALALSPQWKSCTFVVTYDENGGFFDHVPPPLTTDERADQGFDQMGFRVPTMVIGPYVKEGHVSSVVYDHTSVLRHIETLFSLPPLTSRTAAANDLSDCFDQGRMREEDWNPPVMIEQVRLDEWPIDGACYPNGQALAAAFSPTTALTPDELLDHPAFAAAESHAHLLGKWDRRGQEPELLRLISEKLTEHTAEMRRLAKELAPGDTGAR